MSIVIRSNVKASRYITSRLGLSVPVDFKHKLDFTAEDYIYNNTSSTLSQCISTTRASAAGYLNSNQEYATAQANQPRIHNDPHIGKGLLCEDSYTNLIANHTNPPNQTIAFNVTTTQFLVIQMFGEGSCEIQINNTLVAVITKENPYVYRSSVAAAISVKFNNNGEVNHIQAFLSYTPKACMTKLTTTATSKDIHYFRPSLANNSVGTIVMKRTELKDFSSVLIGGRAFISLQLLPATAGYLSLTSAKGSAKNQKSIFSQAIANGVIEEQKFGTSSNDEVFAIAFDFSKNILKVYENGVLSNLKLPEFTDRAGFDRYILGSRVDSGIMIPAPSQIIKELYVYNRVLTDAELNF